MESNNECPLKIFLRVLWNWLISTSLSTSRSTNGRVIVSLMVPCTLVIGCSPYLARAICSVVFPLSILKVPVTFCNAGKGDCQSTCFISNSVEIRPRFSSCASSLSWSRLPANFNDFIFIEPFLNRDCTSA